MYPPKSRLDSLHKKRLKIAEQLRRLAEKENSMRAERDVQSNTEWRTLQSQIKEIKQRLQIIRVNIKRKEYSIKSRRAALETIKTSLDKFKSEEKAVASTLRQLTSKVQELHKAALKRVADKH
jgi:chromosome segregation ATPase